MEVTSLTLLIIGAITLISVISKLFEQILLDICSDYCVLDELQFGFKQVSLSSIFYGFTAVIILAPMIVIY